MVATHRKHHRFSDRPGDPRSPHLEAAQPRLGGWPPLLRDGLRDGSLSPSVGAAG